MIFIALAGERATLRDPTAILILIMTLVTGNTIPALPITMMRRKRIFQFTITIGQTLNAMEMATTTVFVADTAAGIQITNVISATPRMNTVISTQIIITGTAAVIPAETSITHMPISTDGMIRISAQIIITGKIRHLRIMRNGMMCGRGMKMQVAVTGTTGTGGPTMNKKRKQKIFPALNFLN
jgi:hypothetical protein